MSEEDELSSILIALDYLARPKETQSIFTVADVGDKREVALFAALITLSKELNDPTLEEFAKNFLALSRSRKRKGAKELINLFKAARTKTFVTRVMGRTREILVGRRGVEEAEIE